MKDISELYYERILRDGEEGYNNEGIVINRKHYDNYNFREDIGYEEDGSESSICFYGSIRDHKWSYAEFVDFIKFLKSYNLAETMAAFGLMANMDSVSEIKEFVTTLAKIYEKDPSIFECYEPEDFRDVILCLYYCFEDGTFEDLNEIIKDNKNI